MSVISQHEFQYQLPLNIKTVYDDTVKNIGRATKILGGKGWQ